MRKETPPPTSFIRVLVGSDLPPPGSSGFGDREQGLSPLF